MDGRSALAEGARRFARTNSKRAIGALLMEAATANDAPFALVVRDPKAVLDDAFVERLRAAIVDASERYGQDWLVLTPEGTTPGGTLRSSIYCQSASDLIVGRDMEPVIACADEVAVVSLMALRALREDRAVPASRDLTALVRAGYEAGQVSVFHPRLAVGLVTDRPRPTSRAVPSDLLELASSVIARHTQPPTVSIVVRTQFDRPHLLGRLLVSIARARRDEVDVEVVLATDVDRQRAEDELRALRTRHRHVEMRLAHAGGDWEGWPSRTRNLLAGVRDARNAYVWFIDDDDYVDLFAFETLLRYDVGGGAYLVFATADVHAEDWVPRKGALAVLASAEKVSSYPASSWPVLFHGYNVVPVCGALIPKAFLDQRLSSLALVHDLSEDYALFLHLLTAPDLPEIREIAEPLSHVSLRNTGDTTMELTDRRPWIGDITSYLSDLASKAGNPGLFQVLAALAARERRGGDAG